MTVPPARYEFSTYPSLSYSLTKSPSAMAKNSPESENEIKFAFIQIIFVKRFSVGVCTITFWVVKPPKYTPLFDIDTS